MAKYLSQREVKTWIEHYLFFQRKGAQVGSGFVFPCDSSGRVLDNFHLSKVVELRKDGAFNAPKIEIRKMRKVIPPVIECECGKPLELYNAFTITCECGADYNSSGQRLAPRAQWGEETGEDWWECY